MDLKRAPESGVEAATEVDRLPTAPFTLPPPAFEYAWL